MLNLTFSQEVLGGFIVAGLILAVVSSLNMRQKEDDSPITILFLSLVGAIPLWIYVISAVDNDLLLTLGILAGLGYILALQGISYLVLYSKNWNEFFFRCLGVCVVVVFLGGIVFLFILQKDFLDAILYLLDKLSYM